MLIQFWVVDAALHAHPAAAVTVTSNVAPLTATLLKFDGATFTLHEDAAPWLTVKTTPEIVTVPVRAPPVFGATVKETGRLPVPLGSTTVIHDAPLTAVQAQLAAAVTVGLIDPPAALMLPALLDRLTLHVCPAGGPG